jgi:hypothetical protein
MIPEPYLGLLVGASLSIVASIITLFLTNYYSDKQWKRSRNADKSDYVTEQVYSPLLFLFSELPRTLGYLSGYLEGIADRTEYDDSKDILEFKDEFIANNRISVEVKSIILNKYNLISPKEFRNDLRDLVFFADQLEWTLKEIKEDDFRVDEISKTKKLLKNLSKASSVLAASAISLSGFLEELISATDKQNLKLQYTKFFDEKVGTQLSTFLFSQNT